MVNEKTLNRLDGVALVQMLVVEVSSALPVWLCVGAEPRYQLPLLYVN